MTTNLIAENLRPVEALSVLIARHGLVRIVLAIPAALLKRHNERPLAVHDLSAYLQKDIGLIRDSDRSVSWGPR